MKSSRIALFAAIIVVVLIFLPVVPYSQSSSWFYGAGKTTVTADVSPTFLLTHCGAYMDASANSTLLGIASSSSPASTGYNFNCNFKVVAS